MKKTKSNVLTRRDFIRGTVGTIIGTSILGMDWVHGEVAPGSSLVTIVRDKKVMNDELTIDSSILKKMLEQTVMQVTGKKTPREAWLSIVKPDDIVGLVTTPHLNPTHDELTEAVKSALQDVGLSKDNIRIAQGSSQKAKTCTALISMPALKAHWLTGIGTVLKNYIMFSDRPSAYHQQNSAKLGEIWNFPAVKGKTRLVLVDALYPLCDKGPQPDPRYKWAYNGLIAGLDPVAVETVCLRIIIEKRKALRGEDWELTPPPLCVETADKVYGLGTSRSENIKIETIGWEEELLI